MSKFFRENWYWFGAFFFIIFSFYLVNDILFPFIVALVVAYALNPIVTVVSQSIKSRSFIAFLVIFTFFLVIFSLLLVAVPFIKDELFKLALRLPNYGDRLYSVTFPLIEKLNSYFPNEFEEFKKVAGEHLNNMLTWGLRLLVQVLTKSLALANLLMLIIVTPIIAFYMLRDWNQFLEAVKNLIPRRYKGLMLDTAQRINRVLAAYIRGQAMVCLTLAFYYTLLLKLAGLDFGLIIGLIAGFLCFIPYLGAFIGFTAGMGAALAQYQEWTPILWIAGIFLVGQSIESYILTPRLVGNRVQIHPVWIIFALFAGGSLFGFLGLLLGLPTAAAIGVVIRQIIGYYKSTNFYLHDE